MTHMLADNYGLCRHGKGEGRNRRFLRERPYFSSFRFVPDDSTVADFLKASLGVLASALCNNSGYVILADV
jgi:hypothetical protein